MLILSENELNKKKFRWDKREVHVWSRVKKTLFILSETAKKFFQDLKETFITVLIMKHFNLNQSIRVKTDALRFVISDILAQTEKIEKTDQHWHSVMYWSRKMKSVKLNYATLDQKLLTIVKIFRHWHHYLEETHFSVVVLINYENLQIFMTMKKLLRRQVCWAEKLSAYDMWIVYRLRNKNSADELFR